MKALTLFQPWATLVAMGEKRIESRGWATKYRGPLIIHAGKQDKFINPKNGNYILGANPFNILNLLRIDQDALPLGSIVAICNLIEVKEVDQEDWTPARYGWKYGAHEWPGTYQEYKLGDYRPGRFMWFLDDIRPVGLIPYQGKQGLWEYNIDQSPLY